MKTFEIHSSDANLGTFDGETAAHAIIAYHRAAGLRSVVGDDGEVQHDPRDVESGAVVPSQTEALRAVELTHDGKWIDCGEVRFGTVAAMRDGDTVRISYTDDGTERLDSDEAIACAVEQQLGVFVEAPDGEWSAAEGPGEVVQTVRLLDEQPTHEIRFTDARGEVRVIRVHLCDGVAYTATELRAESSADWEVTDDGKWLCNGEVTPGGASGTVEIVTL
jgi:hypothetical protein